MLLLKAGTTVCDIENRFILLLYILYRANLMYSYRLCTYEEIKTGVTDIINQLYLSVSVKDVLSWNVFYVKQEKLMTLDKLERRKQYFSILFCPSDPESLKLKVWRLPIFYKNKRYYMRNVNWLLYMLFSSLQPSVTNFNTESRERKPLTG